MTLEEQPDKLSTAYGIIAVLIWSAAICVSRSLMEKVGMLTAASAIYLLSGIISFFFYFSVNRFRTGGFKVAVSLKHTLICGIPFVLYMLCLYLAVGMASGPQQVIEVGLLNYLWPTFTLIFSIPLLKKHANFWLVPGAVVAFAGIMLSSVVVNRIEFSIRGLFDNFCRNMFPYLLALAAAVLWGLYSNLARRFSSYVSILSVPLFLCMTGFVLVLMRFFVKESSVWSGSAFVELALMVFLPCIGAYVLWDHSMRRGNLVLVASFAYFTPLLSTILTGLYLGVKLTAGIWVACALVIAGAFISKNSVK